ncbi:cupin domain-containing protein [Pelagicoccus sp. SDUM812003]|uniref:cupin domain-containing protein n=1 Tax=Pelagicoccus sp. SDUM812003 TaxID=3041267 RepID=UPI00280FC270|nr:cupin domain-containing protein [Pelagicoccus sp. SDUM812003]MDQ8205465.1 cupin domain-containing protein [Pelagicoccus sp. SDUM812003]
MNIVTIRNCPESIAPDLAVAKEFMSPRVSGLANLSIAEITIPPGVTIKKHYHRESEEVYQVVSGSGVMFLDGESKALHSGQSVAIKVGQWHRIANPSDRPLVMIVTCSPPWRAEDQVFEEGPEET